MSQFVDNDDGWEIQNAKGNKQKQKSSRQNHTANWTLPSIDFIPPVSDPPNFQQFMLLLCGIPGSGKSTFARALERAMPYKVCYVYVMMHYGVSWFFNIMERLTLSFIFQIQYISVCSYQSRRTRKSKKVPSQGPRGSRTRQMSNYRSVQL
jgi:predicted alpha/beta-fold hydrolase